MANIKDIALMADEAYLVSISNKGLYNRALRELEKELPAVSFEGDALKALFADGTAIEITGDIAKAKCACPSRGICKHALMAVVTAQRVFGQESPPEEENLEGQFNWALEMDLAEIRKKAGKTRYKAAYALYLKGGKASFQGRALTVEGQGFKTQFMPQGLEGSICSCKAEAFCSHKAASLLIYIESAKGPLEGAEPEEAQTKALPPEGQAEAISLIKSLVRDTLFVGVSRMPSDMPSRFMEAAALCHASRLATLERLALRAKGHIEASQSKSASFSAPMLASTLAEALWAADRAASGDLKAIGSFRDTYEECGGFEAIGLGAFGWLSKSGYIGLTTLFYAPSLNRVVRYVTSMNQSSGTAFQQLYSLQAPWGLSFKLSTLSRSVIKLASPKMNSQGALSSSASCKAEAVASSAFGDKRLSPIAYSSFKDALSDLWEAKENGSDRMVAILMPEKTGSAEYSQVEQSMSVMLYDKAGIPVEMKIAFSPPFTLALENLEAAAEAAKASPGYFLCECYIDRGKLKAYPIARYFEGILNFSLDIPAQEKKRPKFNWGAK